MSQTGLQDIPEIEDNYDPNLPRESADYIQNQLKSMKALDERATLM